MRHIGCNNANLQAAKNGKDDEFYTTYEDIQKEVSHYEDQFVGKTVYCNSDNPYKSNFCKFFLEHFDRLGLNGLICTSYEPKLGHGYLLDVTCQLDDIAKELHNHVTILDGDGDFRSQECIEFMKVADIVVTNPPFSHFRELISLLVEHKKQYLLVANQNAITYKEVFPLIKNGLARTGRQFGKMEFRVPSTSEVGVKGCYVGRDGQKWRRLGNAMWLTNIGSENCARGLS